MPFGEKLRHTRLLRGLTQAKLAKRSGVCQTEIYRYEVEGMEPTFANLRRLAMALDITSKDLRASEKGNL